MGVMSIREFNQNTSAAFAKVEAGETLDITKNGKVIAEIREKGSVARGFIGVQIQPVTAEVADAIGLKEPRGALVSEAQANSPAGRAGIKRGDTILAVEGEKIADARDLSRKIAKFAPGQKAAVTVWRDGKERIVTVEIGRQQAA